MNENFGAQPERNTLGSDSQIARYLESVKNEPPSIEDLIAESTSMSLSISGKVPLERSDVVRVLAQLEVARESSDIDPQYKNIMDTDIRILSSYLHSEEMSN